MGIFSLAVKIAIICFAALGLYLASGLPQKKFQAAGLVYFTVLSVLFCLLYFIVSLILKGFGVAGGRPMIFIHGAAVLCIAITMTVYHFILAPRLRKGPERYKVFAFPNLCVHYIVPSLTIIDWLLFSPKGQYTLYDPLWWAALVLIYFIVIVLRARLRGRIENSESRYPYYFIDIDAIGVKKTARNVLGLSLVVVAVGYVFVLLDFLLSKI